MVYPSTFGQHIWAQSSEPNPQPYGRHDSSSAMHRQSFYLRNVRVRHRLVKFAPVLKFLVYLFAILYLPFEVYYVFQPGPTVYRNNYPAIILASCLVFTCIQLLLLDQKATTCTLNRWRWWSMRIYWGISTLCAIVYTICYAVARKYECFGVGVATVIASCFAWKRLQELDQQKRGQVQLTTNELMISRRTISTKVEAEMPRISWWSPTRTSMVSKMQDGSPEKLTDNDFLRQLPGYADEMDDDEEDMTWWRSSKKSWLLVTQILRPFRILYIIVCALNVYGSVQNVRISTMSAPGERIQIRSPTYGDTYINFLCTTHSVQNPGNRSLVWFEGSGSQGIMDFQGVQHYLLDHDIASCSYDPPSFGGSDSLGVKSKDYAWVQPALINAFSKSKLYSMPAGGRTYVGWGGAGTNLAIQHAKADEDTSMVITLDPLPPAAKYDMEQQRQNWTDMERGQIFSRDTQARIQHYRLVLSFGVAWGLLTLFPTLLPSTPELYFPRHELSNRQDQHLKDDHLALEYWQLHASLKNSKDGDSLGKNLAVETSLLSIFSYQPNEDMAEQRIFQLIKQDMLKSLGGSPAAPLYCWDCPRDFVVGRAKWTAGKIAEMIKDNQQG